MLLTTCKIYTLILNIFNTPEMDKDVSWDLQKYVRQEGIEPPARRWQRRILPLNHWRYLT